MTVRRRGNSFMVDVKVRGADNPTGEELQVRVAVKSHDAAKRLEPLIRADLIRFGEWGRDLDKHTAGPAEERVKDHRSIGTALALEEFAGRAMPGAKAVVLLVGEDVDCADITLEHFRKTERKLRLRGRTAREAADLLFDFYLLMKRARGEGWTLQRPDWLHWRPDDPVEARRKRFTLRDNALRLLDEIEPPA